MRAEPRNARPAPRKPSREELTCLENHEMPVNRLWARLRLRTSAAALLLGAVMCLAGCVQPTPEDRARIASLEAAYGDRFRFSTAEGLYLRVEPREGERVTDANAEDIFARFFLEDGRKRRETSFVYLNVYDADGDFVYQLSPAGTGYARTESVEYY